MPFGTQRVDPLEQMRKTVSGIVQNQLQIDTAQAQTDVAQKNRASIAGVLDTYKRGISGGNVNPAQERVMATQTMSDLLSAGTPEARQAAQDFGEMRKITQPATPKTEFEGLVNEFGGNTKQAEDEYNTRVMNRIQARKTQRNRTAYDDFSEGYPDTPEGRHRSADAWIKAQTQQAIVKTTAGNRRVATKTVPQSDANGLMVWTGVDSNGQPFMVYPKVKTTWEQWQKLTETARQKATDAAMKIFEKSFPTVDNGDNPGATNKPAASDTGKVDISTQY